METTCDELVSALIPCPLMPLRREGRAFGSEDDPKKEGLVWGRYFKVSIYSSLFFDLMGNKLN